MKMWRLHCEKSSFIYGYKNGTLKIHEPITWHTWSANQIIKSNLLFICIINKIKIQANVLPHINLENKIRKERENKYISYNKNNYNGVFLDNTYYYPNELKLIKQIGITLIQLRTLIDNIRLTWAELANSKSQDFVSEDSYEGNLVNLLYNMGNSMAHSDNTITSTASLYAQENGRRKYQLTISERIDKYFRAIGGKEYLVIFKDKKGYTNFYYPFLCDLKGWIDKFADYTIKKYSEVGQNISKNNLKEEINNHMYDFRFNILKMLSIPYC